MVVLALAATAAHAQEVKAAGHTGAATAANEDPPPIVLASRSTPEPRSSPLARSPGSPDSGDAGTTIREGTAATDYVISTYLEGGGPVVRTYQAPASGPQEEPENVWERAPYVRSITRCGRFYIFQVWSSSTDAWAIDRARLEGPKGAALQVVAVHSTVRDYLSINVIVAAAPPETKLSKVKLHLTGQDGRVAQPEARDLP